MSSWHVPAVFVGFSVIVAVAHFWWERRQARRRAQIAASGRHPAGRRVPVKPWPPRQFTLTDADWDAWLEIEARLEGPDPGWDDIIRMFPREATNREATNYGEDL